MAQASHNFSATFLQKNYIFFTNLSEQKIPQFLATADRNNRELTYPPSRTSNLWTLKRFASVPPILWIWGRDEQLDPTGLKRKFQIFKLPALKKIRAV